MKVSNVRAGSETKPAKTLTTGITTVEDADGVKYSLRKLRPSERYALSDAVESKTVSANLQAIAAASVVMIGEDGMPPISSRSELLERLDEIGDAGLAAITPAVLKLYGVELDAKALADAKN